MNYANNRDGEFEGIIDIRYTYTMYVTDMLDGYNIEELDDYLEGKKDNILIKYNIWTIEIDISGLLKKRVWLIWNWL